MTPAKNPNIDAITVGFCNDVSQSFTAVHLKKGKGSYSRKPRAATPSVG
jgi:hypothetical protein